MDTSGTKHTTSALMVSSEVHTPFLDSRSGKFYGPLTFTS